MAGAVAEACPVSAPCRRELCILDCCDAPLDNCSAPLSQLCSGAGQSWRERWTADDEPATAQLCGSTAVLTGSRVILSRVLSGRYPLPQLAAIPSLTDGHQEVQVSIEIFALDSWDGEEITIVADGAVVWHGAAYHSEGERLCGQDNFLDNVYWANFTLRHSADVLDLQVSNTLDQLPDDESIALGQVLIAVNSPGAGPAARGVRAETWTTLEEYDSFPSDVAVQWIVEKGTVLLNSANFSERVELLDAFSGLLSVQDRADTYMILLLRLSTCLFVSTAATYNIRLVGAGTAVLHIDGEEVREDTALNLETGFRLITVDAIARDTLTLEWRRIDGRRKRGAQ